MGAWGYTVFENDSIMDVVGYTIDQFFTKSEYKTLVDKLNQVRPTHRYIEGVISDSFMTNRVSSTEDRGLIQIVHDFTLNLGEKEIQKRLNSIHYEYENDLYLMNIFKVSFKTCLGLKANNEEFSKYLAGMQHDYSYAESYNKVDLRKEELIQFNKNIIEQQHISQDELKHILSLTSQLISEEAYELNDKTTLIEYFKNHMEKVLLEQEIGDVIGTQKKLKI